MIVPEFWAEAKERVIVKGRSRTYKRFGWSDVSEADAIENAKERVAAAAALAKQGQSVRLFDHKVAYNGAEGLPIREEIVERHGGTVITRNSYGALCLNTPNVLFADVDIPDRSYALFGWALFLTAAAVGYWLRIELGSWWPFAVAIIVGAFLAEPIGSRISELFFAMRQDPFTAAMEKIKAFAKRNATWLLRVYRTPAGFRVLAMHKTFDPDQTEAHNFMKEIGSDKIYMLMCRNQNCFRARVSPKPWRIGVDHIRPRPGVWPIKAEHLQGRSRWISKYNEKAAAFSSCKYEKTLGKGLPARQCEDVKRIHDAMSKSESGLPIA